MSVRILTVLPRLVALTHLFPTVQKPLESHCNSISFYFSPSLSLLSLKLRFYQYYKPTLCHIYRYQIGFHQPTQPKMSLKSGTLSSTSATKGMKLTIIHLPDSFPSSAAFDAINSSLQSDDAERKDAVKKGNAVFAFTLKNKEGQTDSWYIDLKEKGEVAKGEAPNGKKADGQ